MGEVVHPLRPGQTRDDPAIERAKRLMAEAANARRECGQEILAGCRDLEAKATALMALCGSDPNLLAACRNLADQLTTSANTLGAALEGRK